MESTQCSSSHDGKHKRPRPDKLDASIRARIKGYMSNYLFPGNASLGTSNHGSTARQKLEDQNYHGHDQQQMDESSAHPTDQA